MLPWSTPCRDGLHRLTQLIFNKTLPKRLGNQILNGPMLAGLTEAYVGAINSGWAACSRGRQSLAALFCLAWRRHSTSFDFAGRASFAQC